MDSNMKNLGGQNRNAKSSWPLLPRSEILDTVAAAATKSFSNTKVNHLWDSSFSWKLCLPTLSCHKINGHMEKQEMETGNWKWNWKQEWKCNL